MPAVATKAFGTIDIESKDIINFKDGFFGFQDYHTFALLAEGEDSTFQWLQSTEDSNLAFIVISPDVFLKEKYIPDVSSVELEPIGLKSIEECHILLIVTIPESHPEKMTANLQGPVLLNIKEGLGRQVISMNEKHTVRYPILDQMEG